jgi:hypothetical protein
VLHFDDIEGKDIELIEGLPVTTPERTLRDLRADPMQSRYADSFERSLRREQTAD